MGLHRRAMDPAPPCCRWLGHALLAVRGHARISPDADRLRLFRHRVRGSAAAICKSFRTEGPRSADMTAREAAWGREVGPKALPVTLAGANKNFVCGASHCGAAPLLDSLLLFPYAHPRHGCEREGETTAYHGLAWKGVIPSQVS
jgi:hypothetical protein